MEKRIEESKLLFCVRELLPHFSGREIAGKLGQHGYSENHVKEAIELVKKTNPDLSDLATIHAGSSLLGNIFPSAEKLEKLKGNVLRKKPDEIFLEDYAKGSNFVLGFEPNINLMPILIDSLKEKDPRIVGGAAFLLGKLGNVKILDKMAGALDAMKRLAEKNPGALHGENDYEPTEYEIAESILGDAIVSIASKSSFSREGQIEYKKLAPEHSHHNQVFFRLEKIKFNLKSKTVQEQIY